MKNPKVKNNTCPECGSGQLLEKSGTYETSLFDGDETKPLRVANMNWLECDKCGEVILDDPAMDQIEQARYKELGLLSPQEIQEIRLSLGKTQQNMATLLAVGEKTYCRWENGKFYQTRHNDRILRFLRKLRLECPDALRILEEISGVPKHAKQSQPDTRYGSDRVLLNWFGPSLCDHTAHANRKTKRAAYQQVSNW